MGINKIKPLDNHKPVVLVLFLSLILGLIYVFAVPPWQHYDEPNHFEYGWLIATRGVLPQPDEYDQWMRREVAASMIRYGFFKDLTFTPDLSVQDQPIWIGTYTQLINPPLYYMFVSLPLRILHFEDVTSQLYSMRLASLTLYLITVLAASGIAIDITPAHHPLRLFLPFAVAFLPGFVDIMTSVNNDVGAIAFFSLVLWGSIHLVRRGITFPPFVLTAIAVVLCYWTKETAYLAGPIFLFALLISLSNRPIWRRVILILIPASIFIAFLVLLTWDDAFYWYRTTDQVVPTRSRNEKAVLGDYVLQLDSLGNTSPSWSVPLFQPVPISETKKPNEKMYTLGVWMWANEPVSVSTPVVNTDRGESYATVVEVGRDPAFYTVHATVPRKGPNRLWVSLLPPQTDPSKNITVYYDGIVLVEGNRSSESPPEFDDKSGRSGRWGGETFHNLLRNASAEVAGPRFRNWFDIQVIKYLPDNSRPSMILSTLIDWRGAGWLFQLSLGRLSRTFWGLFGWAHVPLVLPRAYLILGMISLLGLFGSVLALLRGLRRNPRCLPWELIILLGLVIIGSWGGAFTRGATYLSISHVYLPVARYVFPVVIPTLLVLTVGWLELLKLLGRLFPKSGLPQYVLYLAFFVGLNVVSIFSILSYYTRR